MMRDVCIYSCHKMPWLPDSFCFVGSPQTPRDCSRVPARVSAEYLERCGPKEGRQKSIFMLRDVIVRLFMYPEDSDVPFSGAAASGPGATVEFKKRPFGILRYQPGAAALDPACPHIF